MSLGIKIKELIYLVSIRIPTILYGKYIAKNLIKVHWGRGLNNFGDCLQPDTLRHYGLTPVYVPSMGKSDIIMAGTILQWLDKDYEGIIIGTGGDQDICCFKKARIIGVRGELTRNQILPPSIYNKNSCLLGDCGLLARLVYPEKINKSHKLGIIPHFMDLKNEVIKELLVNYKNEIILISPLDSPRKVVRRIKECEYIISSSLHGLIIADAFNIPNRRWVDRKTMPNVDFYDRKFIDYYSSLDIEESPIELKGKEDLKGLIELTSSKPHDRINSLILDLDSAMKKIATEFTKKSK